MDTLDIKELINMNIFINCLIAFILHLVIKPKSKPKSKSKPKPKSKSKPPFKIMYKYTGILKEKRNIIFGESETQQYLGGVFLVISLLFVSVVSFLLLNIFFISLPDMLKDFKWGFLLIYYGIEVYFCYKVINFNSINKDILDIYSAINKKNTDEAKRILYPLAKQNVDYMDEAKLIKTTLEVASDNLSFGIVAPMFYIILMGLPFGIMYKASECAFIVTRNRSYKVHPFGRFSEYTFNALNFIPTAILSHMLMIIFKFMKLDQENALYTLKTSGKKKWVPKCSAKTLAIIAGGFNISLGGTKYLKRIPFRRDVIGKESENTGIKTEFIFTMYKLNIIIAISALVLFGLLKFFSYAIFVL